MDLVLKGHPALSTVSDEVDIDSLPSVEISKLVFRMAELVQFLGIGLAANQVAVTKRVIILNTQKTKMVMINPVIVRTWGKKVPSHEECLSFPGLKSRMSRYKKIRVEGYTPQGVTLTRTFNGLDAIVVQHEIDHLNGVTIDD